jgi:hypothetical protein
MEQRTEGVESTGNGRCCVRMVSAGWELSVGSVRTL